MTYNEQAAIRKQCAYQLNAMEDINKNGDVYCTEDELFRSCTHERRGLSFNRFRADKAQLMQAGFLHQEGQHIYAQQTWEYEESAAKRISALLESSVLSRHFTRETLCRGSVPLSEEQQSAVLMALNSPISLILGGAGSGKTTLISAIARTYGCFSRTVIAAPTGKAARSLTERTGIPARTVHGALGKMPDENFLDPVRWMWTELVIIDEASMMTLEMLAGILNRAASNCRIVLLGGPNQLLSVGTGNVIPDLLALGIPCTRLARQYRQSDEAAALRRNVVEFPRLAGADELAWDDSFRMTSAGNDEIAGLICREAARRYLMGEDIQVLGLVNHGPDFSVKALNFRIRDIVNPMTKRKATWKGLRDGDRVIVLKNDRERGICNGDVGTLCITGEKAVLLLSGHRRVSWDTEDPPRGLDLDLSYALTVHKSQGSQYDTIFLPVSTATSRMLYRNLLYTAISRAKREVCLVGSQEAVSLAMQRMLRPRRSKLVAKTNLLRYRRSA